MMRPTRLRFRVELTEAQRDAILDAMEDAWDELNGRTRFNAWNAIAMDDDIVAACLMTQGGEVKRK